ncbi:MAG: SUMF1/EgtB/PvdO family nonheme iron enzyme [Nitrospina sp.]|jgi:gamma-glutamyl hercynylcysteine S-oxide synthase|nr:SUMF1/EgtB/PvdO family nonheme iron enzyme [Nitrospina sp.]
MPEDKNKNIKAPYIISDEPMVADEQLESFNSFQFDVYAKTLAELIGFKENKTPLVIGIYGSWGAGKTTLMKKVEERLIKISEKDGFRRCKTVWFQPWKLESEEAILAGLIEEMFRAMAKGGLEDKVKGKLEELIKKIYESSSAIPESLKVLTGNALDISALFGDLSYKKKLGFYHVFEPLFRDLIWSYAQGMYKKTKDERPNDEKGVVVLFIDDLDRCPKDRVLKVLETIKLFINQPGCVVVLGVAREIIKSALEERYGADEAEQFMQKIVQVTFELPAKSENNIEDFLQALVPEQTILLEHSAMIARALDFNPRAVKRFLNDLNLSQSLIANLNLDIDSGELEKALVVWAILGIAFPAFLAQVRKNQTVVKALQDFASQMQGKEDWRLTEDDLKQLNDEKLHRFARDKNFIDLIRVFPENDELLKAIAGFTDVVKTVPAPSFNKTTGDYQPTAMVTIPKGPFLYGKDNEEKHIDNDYKIDLYPVTNERFGWFVADKGYEKQDLWSDKGWAWREKDNITQPQYWDDAKWNQPDHPVVGVSWYEAEALAKWEGKRLPTELQWERAARGDDGLIYPWGNEFDSEKCNSDESKVRATTPVSRYPEGRSPSGCYDMAGNVWEWVSDWYDTGKALRGGSWGSEPSSMQSVVRGLTSPTARGSNNGFRCSQ